jgi:hypothetical protein
MRLWTLCLVLPIVILMTTGVCFFWTYWPYRYRTVEPLLQSVFASQVKIGHYHRIYFPNPGFMATEITLKRDSAPDLPPFGSARSVTVQGTWLDLLLLRKRVSLVDVTGLHIVIPTLGSRANHEDFPPGSSAGFSGPSAAIGQLRIHESTLDIMRANGSRYSFPIQLLIIRNLENGQALTYDVDMQNAMPTGRILSKGSFGPLDPKNLGATPLSGDFAFAPVNLKDVGNVSGTLSSTGHFSGTLASIDANATENTPDFAVGSGQPTPFSASIHCSINGLNGDVVLDSIEAKTGATTIHVQGGVVGSPKVIDVDMDVQGGRMQDVLRPFTHGNVPIAGEVWLRSHAHLDHTKNGSTFLQRLSVDGAFNAPAERLTDRATEQKLSAFSQRAQGGKSPASDPTAANQDSSSSTDILSSINGRAIIRDGVLSTQRITLHMPGAEVDLSGSFDLRNRTVHLAGNLLMQSDISHATTGFKSILLKPLIPLFKKKKAGAVIPIAITGGPGSYRVTQNLAHQK